MSSRVQALPSPLQVNPSHTTFSKLWFFVFQLKPTPTFGSATELKAPQLITVLTAYITTARFANYSKMKTSWLSFTLPCNAASNGLSWSPDPSTGGISSSQAVFLTWVHVAFWMSSETFQSSPLLPLDPLVNLCYQISQTKPWQKPAVDFSLFRSPAQHCSLGPGRRAVLQPASPCQALFHTLNLSSFIFFFPWSKMWLTPNCRHWTSVTEMHGCFLLHHLVLFPPLRAHSKLKRNLWAGKKLFSTTCGCYNSWEPITAKVSIISSRQVGYRFSAHLFCLIPVKPTCIFYLKKKCSSCQR